MLDICQLILIINLFIYSDAITKKGGKWTDKNLQKYLKSPADYAPGKYRIPVNFILFLEISFNESGFENSEFQQQFYFNLGNAMAFAGLASAKDRDDVIAYLKEQK